MEDTTKVASTTGFDAKKNHALSLSADFGRCIDSFSSRSIADSSIKNSAKYSFGTASKTKPARTVHNARVWIGRAGPGPKYKVNENIFFNRPAKFSFGKSERVTTSIDTKYAYYEGT